MSTRPKGNPDVLSGAWEPVASRAQCHLPVAPIGHKRGFWVLLRGSLFALQFWEGQFGEGCWERVAARHSSWGAEVWLVCTKIEKVDRRRLWE